MAAAKTLAQALLAAQADMPAVEKDGTNPHFKSKFVTLDHLLAVTVPVLNKHGITLLQFPSVGEGGQTLTTILQHESGEKVEYAAPIILQKNDPQGQGSAITYMRRYALAAALGISSEADDDGSAASAPSTPAARQDKPASNGNGKPALTAEQQSAKAQVGSLFKQLGLDTNKKQFEQVTEVLGREVKKTDEIKPDEWQKLHDGLALALEAEADTKEVAQS